MAQVTPLAQNHTSITLSEVEFKALYDFLIGHGLVLKTPLRDLTQKMKTALNQLT